MSMKIGNLVRFHHERDGGPVHRVVSVMSDGMIEIHDMGGYFAPHLFVIADDVTAIPPARSETVLAVYWEWTEGKHAGARFWGCHSLENDGRIRDWPRSGELRALGAAHVTVVEGEGLDLLPPAAAKEHS